MPAERSAQSRHASRPSLRPTPRGAQGQGSHHTVLFTADRSRSSQAGLISRDPGRGAEASVFHHLGGNAHGGEVRHHLLGRQVATKHWPSPSPGKVAMDDVRPAFLRYSIGAT